MLDHSNAKTIGRLLDVLCQVRVTTILANFMLLDVPVDRDVPIIDGSSFMYTCGTIMNIIKGTMSTFDGFVHQQFKVAKTAGTHDYEVGSSSLPKRNRETKTIEEAMLGHVYHENLLWTGCTRAAKSRYNIVLTCLISKQVYSSCIVDWTILNTLGCAETIEEMLEIKVVEMGENQEVFSSEAWRCAFDIREPIYTKLCHELFSTFKFDKEVTDEELISNKLTKFRLSGHGYSLSLLEFDHRLRNDDYFNANDYWVSISSEDQLRLSRSVAQTIRSPVLRVLQKMIAYGLCQRTTGYDKIKRNELWLMSMFEDRNQQRYANVAWVIEKWLKRKGVGTQRQREHDCFLFLTQDLFFSL
ncbi:retrotransposon ORF1 [Tanacetum coccineum]